VAGAARWWRRRQRRLRLRVHLRKRQHLLDNILLRATTPRAEFSAISPPPKTLNPEPYRPRPPHARRLRTSLANGPMLGCHGAMAGVSVTCHSRAHVRVH
jgi:hypothetical protein